MANQIEVKVDARGAIAKMERIPVKVRDELRRVIPDLTRQLGRLVNSKLDGELKSRTHLNVTEVMRENQKRIVGIVGVEWTGDASKSMVPAVLEGGARAHDIVPVNAQALAFFWERMGKNVMFAKVHHPGFPGIHYMERSFNEMKGEIVERITEAAHAGARKA